MAEKPILFNTEMVKAIMEGRKRQTRRLIKAPVLYEVSEPPDRIEKVTLPWADYQFTWHGKAIGGFELKAPYRPGDVLYVRETWTEMPYGFAYRADGEEPDGWDGNDRWYPSIHMPKEAARLFLRVTGVRCERLQNITPHDALREGVKDPYDYQPSSWYDRHNGLLNSAEVAAFAGLWDTTVKPSELEKYGWDANPWVWVIEFERINPQIL